MPTDTHQAEQKKETPVLHTFDSWRQEMLRGGPKVVVAYLRENLRREKGDSDDEHKAQIKGALRDIAKAYDISL